MKIAMIIKKPFVAPETGNKLGVVGDRIWAKSAQRVSELETAGLATKGIGMKLRTPGQRRPEPKATGPAENKAVQPPENKVEEPAPTTTVDETATNDPAATDVNTDDQAPTTDTETPAGEETAPENTVDETPGEDETETVEETAPESVEKTEAQVEADEAASNLLEAQAAFDEASEGDDAELTATKKKELSTAKRKNTMAQKALAKEQGE
jgi:hypothetical protein